MKAPYEKFLQLNQYTNPEHRMACALYSSAINLYWNTWIMTTQYEIDKLVKELIDKKILSVKDWWGWIDIFNYFYDYKLKSNPLLKKITFEKTDPKFKEYLDKHMMIRIWIRVNPAYSYDSQDDWIIQEKDYAKLYWKIAHFTNTITWLRDWWWNDKGKQYIWDSYFWRKDFNLYEINLKELQEDIQMKTCYMYYI
jgi:hypothetical protein